MAITTSSTLSYAVDEAVTEVVFATLAEEPMLVPALFTQLSSTGPRETVASFGGLEYYEEKSESAEMTEDQVVQQFKTVFTHKVYAKKIRLTREIIDDEEWGVVAEHSRLMGSKAAETMEFHGARVFNDAFAGAHVTGEDGLSLCNDAHLNADSGNSQDNSGTNSLNHAGAKTTRTAMRNFTGYDSDQVINVMPDELLVPVDLEEDAFALLESTLVPGGANNDRNIFQGRMTLYVWPFLTDTNAWFMMDSRKRRRFLRWYMRVGLEILSDASFSQGVRTIGGYMRWSRGFTDWRWIYGNNPS